mgnify:CR=1 FL=1
MAVLAIKPARKQAAISSPIAAAMTSETPPTVWDGIHWSKGWIIENNVISHSICSAVALGKYGDLKVFELLSRMIKDSESNMRASAAYALGKLGMAQGVEPLINALSDKDPMVRRPVVASLTALKADLDVDM